jgi:hypothetical protein
MNLQLSMTDVDLVVELMKQASWRLKDEMDETVKIQQYLALGTTLARIQELLQRIACGTDAVGSAAESLSDASNASDMSPMSRA